jgi:hypothetical protein
MGKNNICDVINNPKPADESRIGCFVKTSLTWCAVLLIYLLLSIPHLVYSHIYSENQTGGGRGSCIRKNGLYYLHQENMGL